MGVLGRLTESLRVGTLLRNPFRVEAAPGEFLPTTAVAGLSWSPSTQLVLTFEVEKVPQAPPRPRFGLEYRPLEVLALRLGAADAPTQWSGGLGLRFRSGWFIDSTLKWHAPLGPTPVLSVGYGALPRNARSPAPQPLTDFTPR
ncbi:MAG: hypothetical protein D6765_15350 [Bacteroidetes bacterium]|nr:MAG: hypothetical protein D6765_15350 [Bacteroidota bacterium]